MDNDTRGWIMCATSGIACVVGASIICIDILVRYIPSKRNFRIQDSNIFLASSLSLSFGVMVFSALFSMLPSSKKYLTKSGFSSSTAAWILLAGFVGGFVGIQVVSRFLHHYMPSHVVDCDHSHEEGSQKHTNDHTRRHSVASDGHKINSHPHPKSHIHANGSMESTPLLRHSSKTDGHGPLHDIGRERLSSIERASGLRSQSEQPERRPSMIEVKKRVFSFVKDTKNDCDSAGPCFGYSDPCGQQCFKHIPARTPSHTRHPTIFRTPTSTTLPPTVDEEEEDSERSGRSRARTSPVRINSAHSREVVEDNSSNASESEDLEAQHHHHVPENAFMSIGLQTSIAIALHKLPEGFITYATNHANPSLGFSVFMALFIHNITEGFAMALPLYLALGSRAWAMFWASILGGISQPLGAGFAAAWFKIAGHEGHKPGSTIYGCMFAVTAGIMTSVALQLFVESLSLNHNRNLCIAFAFVGMTIMGMSNALTA